ncbi:MAG: oxidative demethylase AlkB [Planctomycetota bacterium]|jgi:alkylated DNA repair protein (DNA oxidative demethylase)
MTLAAGAVTVLAEGAVVLHGFAAADADDHLAAITAIAAAAPFRNYRVPGGARMSVAMTACGTWGWVADPTGYRYADRDPIGGRPWPAMPEPWRQLARRAAAAAGFPDPDPDGCLINRYAVAARMGLHRDADEDDREACIVSVSLGLPARFRFGGTEKGGPTRSCRLDHGDVAVWGGPARLAYHGIDPVRPGGHPATGAFRYNLTLRRARLRPTGPAAMPQSAANAAEAEL